MYDYRSCMRVKDKEHLHNDRSDRKSFQLVFWLLAAKIGLILLLVILAVGLIYAVQSAGTHDASAVHFGKILGAGFDKNGKRLWVASDSGLTFYENGRWKKGASIKGSRFLPVDNGFIQITDQRHAEYRTSDGQTASAIDLPGNTEGGAWAASYTTHTLWHLNDHSELVFSSDRGRTWVHKQLSGLQGDIHMLAVDPQHTDSFAVATNRGLFLTTDGGSRFTAFLKGESVSSVSYRTGGKETLLAATQGKETALYEIIPAEGKMINIDMGTVESDQLVLILTGSARNGLAAVVTRSGDVYLTQNEGRNWTIIARTGRGLNGQ